jgi:hypothetical protein
MWLKANTELTNYDADIARLLSQRSVLESLGGRCWEAGVGRWVLGSGCWEAGYGNSRCWKRWEAGRLW